ncbi:MAG: radical SAM protein [Lachnospiraceae bacterium]|nr:radical SAM protein [Lachnospiraceae bacterium]
MGISNSGLSVPVKQNHMEQLAEYRENVLRPHPQLHTLFIEMTVNCNEHCRHCGSNCGDITESGALSKEEIIAFLAQVREDFPIKDLMLCVTGGEPLLRPDFFEIMNAAKEMGYAWGMTSNGTLITPEAAHKLRLTGMRTVSISVDGLKETHEWFRQRKSYDRTIEGIQNLLNEGGFDHVQITTVVFKKNLSELDKMYRQFSGLGVRSWRVINIEPIGRAKEQPELLLDAEEYKKLFDFIREKRFAGKMEVCYGCSHFLGAETEREVRPWYFLCNAGVYTASLCYNGDFVSCLDLPRLPKLVEGNVRKDRFKDVWEKKYRIYRTDYRKVGKCADCEYYRYCAGDSFHSWDFDRMEPNLCLKGILF